MTTCERLVLVEAAFDGRLGASEDASLARHRKSCPECTELFDELTATREALRAPRGEIAPLAHQRARLALLKKAAGPATARRRPALVLLAAALVIVPVVAFAGAALAPFGGHQAATPIATAHTSELRRLPPIVHVPPAVPSAPSADPSSAPSSAPPPQKAVAAHSSSSAHMANPVSTGSSASPASPASRDFADAMDAVGRGDFGAGAAMLDRFAATYPGDPRAEEALYLRAIAFERAGRAADASTAARRYLARYPGGAHVAQAQRIARD